MAHHKARVTWELGGGDFAGKKYSRAHRWTFDGGLSVPASSSPDVVKVPYSDPAAVDPEEAFVASCASCHMLSFLWRAGLAGFIVEAYDDEAEGVLAKNEAGRLAITRTTSRTPCSSRSCAPIRSRASSCSIPSAAAAPSRRRG